jgi:hypothetical protein
MDWILGIFPCCKKFLHSRPKLLNQNWILRRYSIVQANEFVGALIRPSLSSFKPRKRFRPQQGLVATCRDSSNEA